VVRLRGRTSSRSSSPRHHLEYLRRRGAGLAGTCGETQSVGDGEKGSRFIEVVHSPVSTISMWEIESSIFDQLYPWVKEGIL
jgi:hypothetical protein